MSEVLVQIDSRLDLRGICVVDPSFTLNVTPFVLLLRSSDDVHVVLGPPWWSAGHVIAAISAVLLLAAGGVFAGCASRGDSVATSDAATVSLGCNSIVRRNAFKAFSW